MKKVQLPVIGGVRKVIQVPGAASVGTTIAEVGSGTVTLAQLAAAINNILNNTGTTVPPGNAAPSASLVLGPGLSGGGVLIGNVPLRLTAPIPALLAEDGADGDIGPPGIQGPIGHTGLQGPQGPAGTGTGSGSSGVTIWIPEDTSYDDFLVPGPAGAAGATGAVGATGPQGPQGPAGSGTGSGGTGTFTMWVPEDTSYDDTIDAPGLVAGQNGQMRTLSVISTLVVGPGSGAAGSNNATLVFPGSTPQILATAAGAVLQLLSANSISIGIIGGVVDALGVQSNGNVIIDGALAGPALTVAPGGSTISGMSVAAGNGTTAVTNTVWKTSTNIVLATMYGNGSFVIGTAGVAALSTGTINVTGGYYINGVSLTQAGNASPTPPGSMIYEDPYWEDTVIPPGQTGPWLTNQVFAGNQLPVHIIAPANAAYTAFEVTDNMNTASYFGVGAAGGVTIANSPSDALTIIAPTSGNAITVNNNADTAPLFTVSINGEFFITPNANFPALYITGSSVAGQSKGARINAGTNTADWALLIENQASTETFFQIFGDGGTVLGNAPGGTKGYGTINADGCWTSGVLLPSTKAATPAVTAGQTDIGTTTTSTVISTAGGVAIPPLAATMWVINVNGVQYGVPCFAL